MNVLLAVALLAIGAVIGFLFAALMETARDDNNRKRWWEE